MKNEITTIHQCDIKWDIDGMSLSQAIAKFQDWLEDYGPEARINLYKEDYYDHEHDIRIITSREETDQEAQARIDKQKRQEQADHHAFEELCKKMGK